MNYATIKEYDTADGVGVRVSLFVSGCTHHCEGCFNPETWDFCYGEKYTQEIQDKIISACKPDYIRGLSVLGGEPFEKANQKDVCELIERFKKEFPQKDVWCYSGYTYGVDIAPNGKVWTEWTPRILKNIKYLVDGEFVLCKKNLKLKFRGSENQRIIDVQKSLNTGGVVLADEDNL